MPPSLAGLIGYEAERRAASGGRNDPDARKQRSSKQLLSPALKLNARTGEEQLQRVAVLGLVYPSAVLAAAVDPYRERRSGGRVPNLREVLAAQSAMLRPLLRELADREEGTRLDPRWYWAAPMLLDQVAGLDVAALIDDDLSFVWASDAEGATASSAVDASLTLVDDVLAGRVALGSRPKDLLSVVTQMAVGGLGVCALRGLSTVLEVSPESASSDVKAAAGEAAWGLRTMFNRPDATLVVRGTGSGALRPTRTGETFSTTPVRARYRAFSTSTCCSCESSLRNEAMAPQTCHDESASPFERPLNFRR